METILQSDLNKSLKLGEVECFTSEQIKSYAQEAYDEINKSTGGKEALMKEVADEIRSFKPFLVVNDDDLSKSIKFIRRAQIAWDEPVGDDISKSRSGTYMNTPENRKLGRVGRRYGASRQVNNNDPQTKRIVAAWEVAADHFRRAKVVPDQDDMIDVMLGELDPEDEGAMTESIKKWFKDSNADAKRMLRNSVAKERKK